MRLIGFTGQKASPVRIYVKKPHRLLCPFNAPLLQAQVVKMHQSMIDLQFVAAIFIFFSSEPNQIGASVAR